MTIEEMRTLTGLSEDATDAEVVAAYAALIDDGIPASIVLVEPVTVELARKQCRIDDDIEDDLIEQKIRSARRWVENFDGGIIARQTLTAHFTSWGDYLAIFRRPIVSVDAIAYNGSAGDDVYTGAAYSLGAFPLKIYPGTTAFPGLRTGGSVTVVYTAGFDPDEVPDDKIEAILVLVGGMMSEREGAYERSLAAAKSLLRPRPEPALA
jgi:uncharacterized phiE125 gp8 family phage protein